MKECHKVTDAAHVPTNAARPKVDQERRRGKSILPKTRRDVGVKQEGANAVIESAKDTFRPPVLLRSVRAC